MLQQKKRGEIGLLALNNFQKDALLETANICTATASRALSTLTHLPVFIQKPELYVDTLEQLKKLFPYSVSLVITSFSRLEGDLNGNIMAMFEKEVVLKICSKIDDRKRKSAILTPQNMEEMQEVGNILFGNYLTGINLLFGTNVMHNPPKVITTLGDSISDLLTLDLKAHNNYLLLKTRIHIASRRSKDLGIFLLLLNIESVNHIMKLIKAIQQK